METGFIYGLASSSDGVIRYIGATKQPIEKRLYYHIEDSKRYGSLKCEWIKSELSIGNKIDSIELDAVPLSEIKKWEVEYIKLFKSFGAKLVNSNRGGDGGCFVKSVIEKLSSHRRGKRLPEQHYINLLESTRKRFGKAEDRRNGDRKYRRKAATQKVSRKGIKRPNLNRPVNQISISGDLIKEWPSLSEACNTLKIQMSCIIKCCNPDKLYKKPQSTAGGFKWSYNKPSNHDDQKN